MKRFLAVGLAVLAFATAAAIFGSRPARAQTTSWAASWAASATVADAGVTIADVTARESAHISVGGQQIRMRLSNAFGTTAATIAHVTVGTSSYSGSNAISGSLYEVTFNGAKGITIPPGAQALSDAVNFPVTAGQNLSVSVFFSATLVNPSINYFSEATSYTSTLGDHTEDPTGTSFSYPDNSYFLLSGIDVYGSTATGSVVAVGDSITEGFGSSIDANQRWTDDLAVRLQGNPIVFGVVNEGMGGNRLLADGGVAGVNGVARIDRDAIAQSGVKDIILALGINDIFFLSTATQITTGYQQFVAQAHAVGLRVIGATITPVGGVAGAAPSMEAVRESVNATIRAGGIFDAYVDFDAAVRNPSHPTQLLPAYNSGDDIHPNAAGYAAMSNSLNLALF